MLYSQDGREVGDDVQKIFELYCIHPTRIPPPKASAEVHGGVFAIREEELGRSCLRGVGRERNRERKR